MKTKALLSPRRIGKIDLLKILLSVVFISCVFIPLIRMFINMDAESFKNVISMGNFSVITRNSMVSASLSTIFTIVIAYLLAVSTERIKIPHKAVFEVLITLPMLIPSISHGMGLIFLFGNNGILTNLLHIQSGIYGLKGIVMGSVLYAFPVAYLMISDILKYQDSSPYEAAEVLGIPKWNQFTQITLPFLRKPLISVIFAVFTMIVTDYGVPLMVGGKYMTIPVVMYQEVIGQLDFGKGAVYGSFLLVPAVFAFIIDTLNKDKGNTGYCSRAFCLESGKMKKFAAILFCVMTSVITLIPVVSFLVLALVKNYPVDMSFTLYNIMDAIKLHSGKYLWNSIVIAFSVSLIGIVIAFFTAYMCARIKSKTSRFLHLAAISSTAIPGIVLGLSYVLTFKGSPIYGTIIVLIMVNIVHFIASPYIMMYNSLSKVNENLESVGLTLGVNRVHMVKDVFIPTCSKTLAEMFSYFFVNCMMTISAVSFLSTTSTKPISLMINQFEAQMKLECASVVSLVILAVNLILKTVIHFVKKKLP